MARAGSEGHRVRTGLVQHGGVIEAEVLAAAAGEGLRQCGLSALPWPGDEDHAGIRQCGRHLDSCVSPVHGRNFTTQWQNYKHLRFSHGPLAEIELSR